MGKKRACPALPCAALCDVRPVECATFARRLDRIIRELTLRSETVNTETDTDQ